MYTCTALNFASLNEKDATNDEGATRAAAVNEVEREKRKEKQEKQTPSELIRAPLSSIGRHKLLCV